MLADPDIEEPGQIAFDGNGRMFVVELRGYDQTLDGIDLTPPIGRISVHEDRDNDGVYEHHRAFVDKMVFPRFVTPFGPNSILTMETNTDEVWKYTDTNGDGVADKKELFTTNFGRAGNIEHQQAGLFWAMDNWLYSTVNAFRVRWTPHGMLREPTGPNGAQWGATQDNYGKVWFQGGASGMPGILPVPRSLRQLRHARPDGAEPQHHLGRADPDRRHSGRTAGHVACPMARSSFRRLQPATTSIEATAFPWTWWAISCTEKSWAGVSVV